MTDIRRFDGHYLVWKLSAHGFRRSIGGQGLPKQRHPTFEAALAEAERLSALWPESTFVVIHEVARVKSDAATVQPALAEGRG